MKCSPSSVRLRPDIRSRLRVSELSGADHCKPDYEIVTTYVIFRIPAVAARIDDAIDSLVPARRLK